jgi:periplasmic protein TonB
LRLNGQRQWSTLALCNLISGDAIDRTELRRWLASAGFVIAVHACLIAAALFTHAQLDLSGTGSLPMMIDLQSVPPTHDTRKLDVAPGPVMQQAPAQQEKTATRKPEKESEVPPAPMQQREAVFAPLERKENPKPAKEKQKRATDKVEQISTPAPRTSAPSPAAQAARANYTGMLSAHLQRFKQYPAASRSAGEQGVAMLNFTVTRNGAVSSSRLSKSSGSSALDGETLAMIRRAQPLPSFPPEMAQSSLNVTVPIRFAIR